MSDFKSGDIVCWYDVISGRFNPALFVAYDGPHTATVLYRGRLMSFVAALLWVKDFY